MKRLWVDANVVLRFLTRDPPDLAAQAARLMERAESGQVQLYLSPLVLAEIVWVLRSFYGHGMSEIRDVLVPLLSASGIEVDDRGNALEALELAASRNVDFVDACLAVEAAASDDPVCTFDSTDFKKLPARWMTPDQAAQPGEVPKPPTREPDVGKKGRGSRR